MDAVEKANAERQRKWCALLVSCLFLLSQSSYIMICRIKDKKVGEGTYAVVYQGRCSCHAATHTIRLTMKVSI